MDNRVFYLTTTLPYVNAPLHMGHALEFVRADTIARWKKKRGYDVFFNTGTDEHGVKIYLKSQELNLSVQDFVDQGFETFKDQLSMFGVMEDIHFIRTTDLNHQKAAQEFWRLVDKNGYIYKKKYQTKYCVGCESEKTDSELNNGECPLHPGKELSLIDEENYFFKYSVFGSKLIDLYQKRKDFVVPDFRFNEIKSFVENGLQDFSISRLKTKMPWGIEVPGDSSQVMYVWFDALVNYISTLGWPDDQEKFNHYWVNGLPTQYCGKDNLRFQAAMWQAMLMAAGLPNSYQIVVNGFITGEGGIRMSKTLGNVVDPREVVSDYGVDALRYFLLREVSSFEDSPFSWDRFKESYNANLANGLGNLVNRITKMSETYFDQPIVLTESDLPDNFIQAMDGYDLNKAINFIWAKISELDSFITINKPFSLIKTDQQKGLADIEFLVKELFFISVLLEPFLPQTAQTIKQALVDNKKPIEPIFNRL